jgi:putative holliday junction resolvase
MAPRILAIDFGIRRLGFAISDPLRVTAQGLPTLERPNEAAGLAQILKLIDQYEVDEVVIGYPLSMEGAATAMSRRVLKFAERLRRHRECEVKLWDERLSTAEANRLLRSTGVGLRKRSRAVDRVAATLILQNYLDSRSHEKVRSGAAGAAKPDTL